MGSQPASEADRRLLRFGNFELSCQTGELRKLGIKIKLQQKPLEVLCCLLENPGTIVSREELQRRLWPDGVFVDFDHGLNTAVKKLRAALGDTALTPRYIATVDRQGYRFVAPVATVDTASAPQSRPKEASGPVELEPAHLESTSRSVWVRLMLAAGALALTISGALYYKSVRASRLGGNDTVLIADFANSTGEPVFDDALKQALTISLRQSPFLDMVPEGKIGPTLKQMTRPPSTPVTGDVAQQVCQRVGAKAYIAGAIAALGNEYVLGLKAINCQNGDVLAGEQLTAASKEKVIPVLGQAATKLRRELGESLATVQQYDVPLAQETTSSLDALKAFSIGMEIFNTGKYADSISLFKRAIELDPNFALAYEALGITYNNSSRHDEGVEYLRRAYALRDHASELEKLLITTSLYNVVTHESDKGIETLELMRRLYPRNSSITNNLAIEYLDSGRLEDALAVEQETMRLAPNAHTSYEELGIIDIGLNRFADAKEVRQKEIALKLDYHWDHVDLYNVAFWENDSAAMQRELNWAKGKPYEFFMLMAQAGDDVALGKLSEAKPVFQAAIAGAEHAHFADVSASLPVESDLAQVLLGVTPKFSKPTQDVLKPGSSSNALRRAGFAYAAVGDAARANSIADELLKRDPQGTFANNVYAPVIRAEAELRKGHAAEAITTLQNATPYEFGWRTQNWSNYVRGCAYLKLGNPTLAATEFQKIIDHQGISLGDSLSPLVYVLSIQELARARAAAGDTAGAKTAYQQFLGLWKDADTNLPPLKDAKLELARLP